MSQNLNTNPSCSIQNHDNYPIHYFCLDEYCFNKRLFCQVCARIQHRKHRIGRIDRLIQPLSLLNINSFHENSQQVYQNLKEKIDNFYEILGSLQNLFDKAIKEIQNTTFFQINCLLQTFSQNKIEQVEQLFLSHSPKQEEVKSAIQMINFLQFQGVQQCQTVKNVCQVTLQKMTKTVQKTTEKMQKIFQKMIKNIKQNDFISQMRKYKFNLQIQGRKRMQQVQKQKAKWDNQEQKLSDTQLPNQKNNYVKKQFGQNQKQQKFSIKSLNQCNIKSSNKFENDKLTFLTKFKAFFQEEQLGQMNKQKMKKDKNLILVKKQY